MYSLMDSDRLDISTSLISSCQRGQTVPSGGEEGEAHAIHSRVDVDLDVGADESGDHVACRFGLEPVVEIHGSYGD